MKKIRIDEPCLVDWNSMSKTEIGRFCSDCQKEVIDFSALSTHDLVRRIQTFEKTDAVCGHFRNEQLELDLHKLEHYEGTFRLSQVLLGLSLATFIGTSSYAQQEIQRSPSDTVQIGSSEPKMVIQGNFVVKYDHSTEQFASGTVISGSAPIKNAVIVLVDLNGVELKRILTNELGEFKMDLVWGSHPTRIRIEKSGYADVHILFSRRESIADMDINMYHKHTGMKGKFVID